MTTTTTHCITNYTVIIYLQVKVDNQPTYKKYKISVISGNIKGDNDENIDEIIGYSGEGSKYTIPYPLLALAYGLSKP